MNKLKFSLIISLITFNIFTEQENHMNILHKHQTHKHAHNSACIVYEYPMGDADMNGAVAQLSGRYPEEDRVVNTQSKEMGYVVQGSGKIVIEGKEILLQQGSLVLIQAGEKYYWEGHMTLFLSCAPAWNPAQHKKIK